MIIWVELTREQRAYYRGLYNRDIGTLLSGASNKNLPNMRNLAMELRKVCCHPVRVHAQPCALSILGARNPHLWGSVVCEQPPSPPPR